MPTYLLNNRSIEPTDPDLQARLATAYASKIRPHCACKAPPVPMYITKIAGAYHIKRMPNTGSDHHPACETYDPPPELSGLGEVLGSAIREDSETGLINLRLDFSLKKTAGRAAPTPTEVEHGSVKSDSNKLTIRALLHYLWDNSKLTHWNPSWDGRRNWAVVFNQLNHAIADKQTKGLNLCESLFIPPPFSVEKKDEIQAARSAFLARLQASQNGVQRKGILIGELKAIEPGRFGFKMVIKHMPDYSFTLNDDIMRRINKRFEAEMALWSHFEETHLIAISTFSVNTAGMSMVEEIGFMLVTKNWIPFTDMNEKTLLDRLTLDQRRFIKGLRYNMPKERPLASAQLVDTPKPVALFISSENASDEYNSAFDDLREKNDQLIYWIWDISLPLPALPERTTRALPQ